MKQLKKTICRNQDKRCARVEVDKRHKITTGWVLISTLIKTETIKPVGFLKLLNINEEAEDSVITRNLSVRPYIN